MLEAEACRRRYALEEIRRIVLRLAERQFYARAIGGIALIRLVRDIHVDAGEDDLLQRGDKGFGVDHLDAFRAVRQSGLHRIEDVFEIEAAQRELRHFHRAVFGVEIHALNDIFAEPPLGEARHAEAVYLKHFHTRVRRQFDGDVAHLHLAEVKAAEHVDGEKPEFHAELRRRVRHRRLVSEHRKQRHERRLRRAALDVADRHCADLDLDLRVDLDHIIVDGHVLVENLQRLGVVGARHAHDARYAGHVDILAGDRPVGAGHRNALGVIRLDRAAGRAQRADIALGDIHHADVAVGDFLHHPRQLRPPRDLRNRDRRRRQPLQPLDHRRGAVGVEDRRKIAV